MQNTSFSRISLIAIAAVVLVAGSVANATLIDSVSGNLGSGWFYNGPDAEEGPTSEIALDVAYQNGTIGYGTNQSWLIDNARLTWTGSKLNADDSTGGIADATFQAGGVITLAGDVYDESENMIAENKVLFTGTVTDVRFFEQFDTNNLDQVNAMARLNITGGWLTDNPYDIEMSGLYTVAVPITNANQSYGYLKDFQDDIWATGGGLSGFVAIPEPGTCLFLFFGAVGMFLRRRSR